MKIRPLILTSIALLALCASASATTFGLEGSIGDMPTFSVTSGGVTATFTSPTGNGFAVQNTAGLLTFNTALLDNNFFGTDPLTISFSRPVSGTILVPFAILDSYSTTDLLTVTANTGQTARILGIPDGLALGEPEGIASFSLNAPASEITLTSSEAFAIGDITTVAPIPEPTSLVLLATGLAGMAVRLRRAR